MIELVVETADDGEKLDRIVARALNVSRRIARVVIGEGGVTVNGKPWKIIAKPVRAGAKVAIDRSREAVAEQHQPQGEATLEPQRILHYDRELVVVDKPAGLLSETDRIGSVSLQTLVPKLLAAMNERNRDIWLVHRLDAGTSGVIVLARTAAAARKLDATFRETKATKRYLALCNGRLSTPRDVDAAIGRAQGTRQKVDPQEGKPAFTTLVPRAVGTTATLVEARPRTGRTHQIRVHAAHAGHPLLGDRLYGGPVYTASTPPQAIGRVMLHAHSLTVPHPATGKPTCWIATPPKDFVALATTLGLADGL